MAHGGVVLGGGFLSICPPPPDLVSPSKTKTYDIFSAVLPTGGAVRSRWSWVYGAPGRQRRPTCGRLRGDEAGTPANRPPKARGLISHQALKLEGNAATVDVADNFADRMGDGPRIHSYIVQIAKGAVKWTG